MCLRAFVPNCILPLSPLVYHRIHPSNLKLLHLRFLRIQVCSLLHGFLFSYWAGMARGTPRIAKPLEAVRSQFSSENGTDLELLNENNQVCRSVAPKRPKLGKIFGVGLLQGSQTLTIAFPLSGTL